VTLTLLRRRLLLLLLPLTAAGLAVGYQEIQVRLERPETRHFLEAKAREVLGTEVKIGRLSYLPPAGLSLEEIQLSPKEEPSGPSLASIKRLVFGYGLLNLIRHDFRIPTTFRVDSPRIQFSAGRLPLPFLGFTFGSSSSMVPAKLVIENGEFHYPWGTEGRELVLSKVQLVAKPDARGRIQLKLRSKFEGVAGGSLEVRGFTDPAFHRYELKVRLKNVTFLPESRVPLRGMEGRFLVSDEVIEIESLTSFLHEWQIKTSGRIENWQAAPRVFLEFKRQKGEPPFQGSLRLDFGTHQLEGTGSWGGRLHAFEGKVFQEKGKILFSDLKLPNQYRGHGEWSPSSGGYEFWLEREKRRFHLRSNLSRLAFETEFELDHALINHLDWVVKGRVRLGPLSGRSGDRELRLKGEVRTDYLIVEYQPLQDFRGNFELGSEGIQAIDCQWHNTFHLGGTVLFRGGELKEDLVLRSDGFSLKDVRTFAGRPVSSNLSGILEGKLKLRGEPSRPEVQGYFTLKDGTIGKLDFDRGLIQFQGFPPYLKLFDSTILKGRNTLKLTGAINLGLKNIFRGIQIRGPDHLVIWKGMSVYWKKGESAIEAERPLGRRVAMGLEVGQGVPESGEDPEENHALFGPKVKF